MKSSRHFFRSLAIHVAVLGALWFLVKREIPAPLPAFVRVQLVKSAGRPEQSKLSASAKAARDATARRGSSNRRAAVDLRPEYMRQGGLVSPAPSAPVPSDQDIGTPFSRDLLFAESKVSRIFDQLAARINGHLDFPEMLAENGIAGTAGVDLVFDRFGEVDEARSQTTGDNRLVRGVLVKAVRRGLVDWLRADSFRLRKDQFRNQQFHADFVIVNSNLVPPSPAMTGDGGGSYTFSRRFVSSAACVLSGSVDLACLAMRAAGAVRRTVSDQYKGQFSALKDELESYDDRDLHGIMADARG